jgi:CubicO group peptidase (beta-lactamase class C family)
MGLARLAGEFFNPLLIDPDTWADATRVWYPDLGGVLPGVGRFQPLGWGLGFEVREEKYPHWTGSLNSPATVGHFGGSGSFLWYDPVAAVAVGGMSEREFGDWALDAWPEFFDEILIGVT